MLNTESRIRLVESKGLAALINDYLFYIRDAGCVVEDDQAGNIAACCRIVVRNIEEILSHLNKEEAE